MIEVAIIRADVRTILSSFMVYNITLAYVVATSGKTYMQEDRYYL